MLEVMQIGKSLLSNTLENEVKMKRKYSTLGALVLASALIIIGIVMGQNESVLLKAIKICLECVGIG